MTTQVNEFYSLELNQDTHQDKSFLYAQNHLPTHSYFQPSTELEPEEVLSLCEDEDNCLLQPEHAQSFTIIEVAINRMFYRTFDYKLSGHYNNSIIGSRVKVSFGAQKDEIGIVVKIKENSDYELKKIKVAELLDPKSLISPDVFATLVYASKYYHYPLGQTLPLAFPKLLREGGDPTYKKVAALEYALDPDDETTFNEELAKLKSPKQKQLLTLIKQEIHKCSQVRELGFSSAQENALIKKGLIKKIDAAQSQNPFELNPNKILAQEPFKLNHEQQYVVNNINHSAGHNVFVINGVTGSGKTEVYLQIIHHTLLQGKKVLILVPEISLTPQTFKRFYNRFKVPIATLHSSLGDRERLDNFLDMLNERAYILIGTRSALFASIKNLGLIVIDEEHDSSFKQADGLRYHARTLAQYRAQINHCNLVLGSATVSLESVYNIILGKYIKLDMLQRAKDVQMPIFNVVDLKKQKVSDNLKAGIGNILEEEVGVETAQHHQALLFLNRRGYSYSLVCNECGRVMNCPNCDNQFTVHKASNTLRCHICNTTTKILQDCPYCGGQNCMVEVGLGTEQVADYLTKRFMDVGIERIDRDVINSKKDLDNALERVLKHDSEILIGTQMLSKGHDFPDVTLVGILDIDAGLFSDDYRGLEYTSQLITQVAGRAGRDQIQGQVLIQTRYPEHPLIQKLIAPGFNYYQLTLELLEIREELSLPPYSYQAIVMTNSASRSKSFKTLQEVLTQVEAQTELIKGMDISPILSDKIEKRANRFHFHFVITTTNQRALHQLLDFITDVYGRLKHLNDVRFAIDVDPINMI